MQLRRWVRSGIVEQFDKRQIEFLDLVYSNIEKYYKEDYQLKPRSKNPLSLSRLARMCNRSKQSISLAVRILANTVSGGAEHPSVYYNRIQSKRNATHRPFQILIRNQSGIK